MISMDRIHMFFHARKEFLHELNTCNGWVEFCRAIDKFEWRPEQCMFVELKDMVDDLEIIDAIYVSKRKVRLIIKISYVDLEENLYYDQLEVDFTERELNYKTAMKQWIKSKNLAAQKERQKSDWSNLNKLVRRYKEDPRLLKLIKKLGFQEKLAV